MGYKVNEHDLASSLAYRFAMWRGIPVQLLAVQETGNGARRDDYGRSSYVNKLYARKVGTSGEKFKVDPLEPSLSVDACQGGYCFSENSKELAFLEIINGNFKNSWCTSGWPGEHDSASKKVLNCIMNKHPTFKEAYEQVTNLLGRKKACSFDRDFALVRDVGFSDIAVHYRGKSIGTFDPKTKRIVLRKGPTIKLLKRKLDRLMKEEDNG